MGFHCKKFPLLVSIYSKQVSAPFFCEGSTSLKILLSWYLLIKRISVRLGFNKISFQRFCHE